MTTARPQEDRDDHREPPRESKDETRDPDAERDRKRLPWRRVAYLCPL